MSIILFSLCTVACTPFSPILINMEDWRLGDPSQDPLADHQPETIDCSVTSFRIESEQLEVETDLCNYAFVEFDLLQNVPKGTPADLLLLHTGLWAPEPASAHTALLIDGVIFWEQEVSIPASAEFFFYEGEFPIDASEGSSVQLHVHNHGANDWRLGYFRRIEEE